MWTALLNQELPPFTEQHTKGTQRLFSCYWEEELAQLYRTVMGKFHYIRYNISGFNGTNIYQYICTQTVLLHTFAFCFSFFFFSNLLCKKSNICQVMPFNILMCYAPQRDLDRAPMILKSVTWTSSKYMYSISILSFSIPKLYRSERCKMCTYWYICTYSLFSYIYHKNPTHRNINLFNRLWKWRRMT